MVIVIIGLLLAFMAGFFIAIKSVQLGLRWQIQTQQKQEPEIKNPVKEAVQVVQNIQHSKQVNYTADQLNEWLNGKEVV